MMIDNIKIVNRISTLEATLVPASAKRWLWCACGSNVGSECILCLFPLSSNSVHVRRTMVCSNLLLH